jgi:hypothetical protein
MDELIKLLTEKTGLPDDKARIAVDTIVGFLKQRLPAGVAEQLNTVLTAPAGEGIAEKVKGMAAGLGGVFKKTG